MSISNTQLAQSLQTHLNTLLARDTEISDWLDGAYDGGPNSDGKYPLTSINNTFGLFKSPARLEWEVGNSTDGATSAKGDAELSANAALATLAQINALKVIIDSVAATMNSDKTTSEAAKIAAEAARGAAIANHNSILLLKTDIDTIEANILTLQALSFADAGDATIAANTAEAAKALAIDAQLGAESARDIALNAVNYYTQAQVDQIISDLVNGSPATMDTLNELAAALGDDPNFATTITNQIAGKSDLGHSHVYGDISGLAADLNSRSLTTHNHDTAYSAITHDHDIIDVFGLQGELDGKSGVAHNHDTAYLSKTGKAVDSDKLDGLDSSSFGKLSSTQTWTGNNTFSQAVRSTIGHGLVLGSTGEFGDFLGINDNTGYGGAYVGKTGYWIRTGNSTEQAKIQRGTSAYTIWHAGNDGSGSGLDADLLDGQQGSYYSPATHGHSFITGATYAGNPDAWANDTPRGALRYDAVSASSSGALPTSNNANGVVSVGGHDGGYTDQLGFSSNGNLYHRNRDTETVLVNPTQ